MSLPYIILAAIFRDELTGVAKTLLEFSKQSCLAQIEIDSKSNPRLRFAIKEKIKSFDENRSKIIMRDGHKGPIEDLAEGYYYYMPFLANWLHEWKYYVYFSYGEEKITMFAIRPYVTNKDLKRLLNGMCETYCPPSKKSLFYTSNGDKWHPFLRDTRNINCVKITEHMQLTIDDISKFLTSQKDYEKNGWPFRKGYLLKGPPGTGKTTCIEIAAQKQNMPIYILNMNASSMSDETLIKLLVDVPNRSIVVLEEFEKQLENIKKNPNNMVSHAGILSALDGPARLSKSTIVMITANSLKGFNKEFKSALLRPGRIDKLIDFDPKKDIKSEEPKNITKKNQGNKIILPYVLSVITFILFLSPGILYLYSL